MGCVSDQDSCYFLFIYPNFIAMTGNKILQRRLPLISVYAEDE